MRGISSAERRCIGISLREVWAFGRNRPAGVLAILTNSVSRAMLTLQETLTSQTDLGQLCADRPLKTGAIFPGNAFYGHDRVLSQYCGLPQTYPLKVILSHGVGSLSETYVWEAERAALLPVALCYSRHRERAYVSQTDKKAILCASPFLYAVEMLKN